jgi:hypothetical protein
MKPRGCRYVDPETVAQAIAHLRIARNLLAGMQATKAADRVRAALKSAEGAQRHTNGLWLRLERAGQWRGIGGSLLRQDWDPNSHFTRIVTAMHPRLYAESQSLHQSAANEDLTVD